MRAPRAPGLRTLPMHGAAFMRLCERLMFADAREALPALHRAEHPERPAVGAAHAGWRGLAGEGGQGIVEATCAALQAGTGANLVKSFVWLGPCIGPEAFEVDADERHVAVLRDESVVAASVDGADGGDAGKRGCALGEAADEDHGHEQRRDDDEEAEVGEVETEVGRADRGRRGQAPYRLHRDAQRLWTDRAAQFAGQALGDSGRVVAIKFIRPEFAANHEFRQRFVLDGTVPEAIATEILRLQTVREQADYDAAQIPAEQAHAAIDAVRAFVDAVSNAL